MALIGQYVPGGGSGSSNFIGLLDTPSSYSGQGGKIPAVNTAEDALEFINQTSGGGGGLTPAYTNTNLAVLSNSLVMANTLSNTITLTLPDAPDDGARVLILDVRSSFGTNNVTINPNGKSIESSTSNVVLNVNSLLVQLIYTANTNNWRMTQQICSKNLNNQTFIKIINNNYTATHGDFLLVDVSSAAVTVTLPASPAVGTYIRIVDSMAQSSLRNIIVARNSQLIDALAENFTMDIDGSDMEFVFVGGARGWHINASGGSTLCV